MSNQDQFDECRKSQDNWEQQYSGEILHETGCPSLKGDMTTPLELTEQRVKRYSNSQKIGKNDF